MQLTGSARCEGGHAPPPQLIRVFDGPSEEVAVDVRGVVWLLAPLGTRLALTSRRSVQFEQGTDSKRPKVTGRRSAERTPVPLRGRTRTE
jgi:hypothetical protein